MKLPTLRKDEIWYVLFLLPGFGLFAFALLIPLVLGVRYSFTDWDGIGPDPKFIGWENYIDAVADTDLWFSLANTFGYAIVLTLLVTAVSLPLALALDTKAPLRKLFRSVFFLPGVLSVVLAGYIWSYNYSFGYAEIARLIGWTDYASPLGNPTTAMGGLLAIALWQGIGTPMIIYLAGLQSIPQELVEAATIDGAHPAGVFFRIKLPLLAPAITINMILGFTGALKVFDLVFVTTNGGPAFSTQVMSTFIYFNSFANQRGGYGMALSMIFFLVLLAVTLVQLVIFRRREVEL